MLLGITIELIVSTIIVKATETIYFASVDVSFDNTETTLSLTTVKGAIDKLSQ